MVARLSRLQDLEPRMCDWMEDAAFGRQHVHVRGAPPADALSIHLEISFHTAPYGRLSFLLPPWPSTTMLNVAWVSVRYGTLRRSRGEFSQKNGVGSQSRQPPSRDAR